MTDFRLLINGRLVPGTGTLDVINPATGRTLTASPRADRAQLDQAVAAAKTALPAWSATPLRQRGALLVKLAEAVEVEQGDFARLLTQEQGKPLPQALDEIALSVATIRYFATLDPPPEGPRPASAGPAGSRSRRRRPRGRGGGAREPGGTGLRPAPGRHRRTARCR